MEFFRTVLCSSILLASTIASWAQTDGGPLAYPKAKTVDQVDDYHGTNVADPYRWLEDADSPDTKAWVEEEDKLTFGYLEKIPYRGAIRERLLKLWNYERFTTPEQENGRYFYQHNNVLQWSKFSGAAWSKDDKGFFYSRYDEPKGTALRDTNYFQKLYHHQLGTSQAEDKLIYERPDNKELLFGGSVTDDGRYLIIHVSQGTSPKNRLYYKDLTKPDAPVVKLLDDFDAQYLFVDNDGPVFWIQTDLQSPRSKLIAIDTRHPERANWKTIVPETQDKLEQSTVVDNRFLLSYLKDARTEVRLYDLQGRAIRNVDLPGIGTASGFQGKRTDKETFYSFTSFILPTTVYRYEPSSGKSSVFKQPKVDFDASQYETKQVFYNSKDGTRVPMFLTYKKGLKLDGQNPTLLYAYGGFDISLTPSFSVPNLVWLEMGGVYAQPNLRGGGEYGEKWHTPGTKTHKTNVFEHFIAPRGGRVANRETPPQ